MSNPTPDQPRQQVSPRPASSSSNAWRAARVRGLQQASQEGWDMADTAWIIFSHLLTGILVYAGLGWLLSLWLGNAPLLIGAGALIGMFLSLYLIHRRLEAKSPEEGKGPAVTDRATRIMRDHKGSL